MAAATRFRSNLAGDILKQGHATKNKAAAAMCCFEQHMVAAAIFQTLGLYLKLPLIMHFG